METAGIKKYSIPRHIWRAIYPLLVWVGISFFVLMAAGILNFVANILISGMQLDTAIEVTLTFILEQSLLLTLIGNVIAILLFALMWRKIRLKLEKYDNSKLTALSLILTIILSAALNFFLVAIFGITNITELFPSYDYIAEILMSGSLLVRIISIGIAAPIVEEILCRGIILNRLSAWMPKWPAILVSSALFGIVHFNWLQGLYAFAIGIIFAVLYLRYRNLWIPIISHAAFNLANVILVEVVNYFEIDINVFAILIPSALITIASTIFVLKFTKKAVLIPEPAVEPEAVQYFPPQV
ncbi:MAG: CPBP family intramembrane metalloprotease [Oscillospiraceae bacterium]|nr:CPBP family intramembrane metalloprotease [Oscillospiraceae bacterium]